MSDLVRKSATILVVAVFALGTTYGFGVTGPAAVAQGSGRGTNPATAIAVSRTEQFVGAVSGNSYLFVGLLNGTVLRMNPLTGHISASVRLPDGNSAAHLTFYNGSLYVGTEWLHGARNEAPFHVYKIEPTTMGILGQVPMTSHDANGFVMAFDGFLWAGDGRCTLFKIDPNSMQVKGTVPHVAEDEMLFDGIHYWAECSNVVNVLKPGSGLPVLIASGSLTFPNRPRGFFMIGTGVYSSGSRDFALYSMTISGNSVVFSKAGALDGHSLQTRDTLSYGGLLYVYETGPGADSGKIPARIFVYGHDLLLRAVIPLPGPALGLDASQHSLFVFNGRFYFVTASSVGFVDPSLVRTTSTITSVTQTSTPVSHTTSTVSATATPSIDRTLLVLLMVIVGVAFVVIYLFRAKAVRT